MNADPRHPDPGHTDPDSWCVAGVVAAVSGTCTHQGCRLQLNAPSRQLDCPCHMTVFALDGELVAHQLPVPPGPLPHIATREVNGSVQIYSV